MNNPEYVTISNLKRLLGKYYKLQTFNTLYSDSCSLCTIGVNICTPVHVSCFKKQIYCAIFFPVYSVDHTKISFLKP